MKKFLLLSFLIAFSASVFDAWAQERIVSGTVTSSEDGEPLPGVNVVLKGTTIGTVTDLDGSYSLNVPAEGGTLQFSFIGLATEEVAIGNRSVIDVQMQPDAQQLTEVVVTAFNIERQREELTYVTERVSAEDLVIAEQPRAAQGLAGKVAGLQINVQNNGVNPTTQILLRGLRSITASNTALIVIDGTIASSAAFDDLNPHDIATIDVLKGATAAALYGSRAGNGALIVQTKEGGYGQDFRVGLKTNYVLEEVAYMPDFQTKHGIGWDGHYDPIENTNWGPRFDGVVRQIGPTFRDGSFQAVPYAPIQDNLKDFYETGSTFQNTVYFSGGGEESKFYFSVGNQNTTGIVPDDEYQRTTVRANATHRVGKVELSVRAGYMKDETDVVGNTIGDQDRPLYWFVLNTPANIPLTDYKDWWNPASYAHADNYYNAYYQNPYWAIGTNRNLDESSRLFANVAASYEITDNINWETRIGVNNTSGFGKNWRARQEYDEFLQPWHSTVSSFVEDTEFESNEYNGSSFVSGKFQVTDEITINPILGASFIQSSSISNYLRGNNLSIPGFYHISNRTGELQASSTQTQRREYGFFGDVTVGYNNFLFLNATGRQDYTSTLPEEESGYFYPSVGLSFVLSEAVAPIRESNIISYAKVSVGNSTVYNDLAPYAVNENYVQHGAFPFGSLSGFLLSGTTVDETITKERLNTTEFGATLGFFDNRVTLDAAYFITKTTDLITHTTPSVASGASTFLTNIGELEGSGLELSLGGNVLRTSDFIWELNANYSSYETIVKEIKEDLEEVAVASSTAGYGIFAVKGEPFPQLKASSYVRDDQGRVVVDASSGNPIVGDVIAHGTTLPKHIFGLTSRMGYKGFTLSATFDYRTGHVYYEQGSDAMEFTGRSIASVSSNRQDFVWPNSVIQVSEGVFEENTNIPITGGVMTFWQNRYNEIKENYVKDATALKIRELALNYNFPRSILDRTNVINRLVLGFISRNPLTFLPEENRFADPEFNNTNSNAIGIGGYFQSPPTRTYGFNLTIEF